MVAPATPGGHHSLLFRRVVLDQAPTLHTGGCVPRHHHGGHG